MNEQQAAELLTQAGAILEGVSTTSARLSRIEGYAAVLAVACCMGVGLVLWRLALLSKNQRRLF